MTSFFFKLEYCYSEASQTKNFRVRHPPILHLEKKIAECGFWTHAQNWRQIMHHQLYQQSHHAF